MQYRNYIGGKWVDAHSGATMEDINPANEELLGVVARSDARDAEAAVEAAAKAYPSWRLTPAPKRGEILYRVGQILVERKEDLARLLTRTVEELGPSALAAAQRLAYEEGLTLGRALAGRVLKSPARLAGMGGDAGAPSAAQALALESLQAALDADGAVGQGIWERRDGQLHVRFCTCALREIAEEYPQTVCSLHRSYLHGLVEGLVGPVDMVAESSMLAGDDATCDWRFCPAGAPCAAVSTP